MTQVRQSFHPFLLVLPVAVLTLVGLGSCRRDDKLVTPVRKNIVEAVFATGHLSMSDEYVVATNQEGFVAEVFVQPGQQVVAGEPLFRLSSPVTSSELSTARAKYRDSKRKADRNSPSISSLKAQIRQAEKQVELDTQNRDRYQALLKSNAASELDVDHAELRLETAISNLRVLRESLADLRKELSLNVRVSKDQLKIVESRQGDYLIKATRDGKVLEVFKERGELARKGESLARVGGGNFLATLFVAEEDIHLIEVGQAAKVGLNTNKSRVFDGRVAKIYPSFDAKNQSFRLEATFDSKDEKLFAGTQLQANILVDERQDALVIPIACVAGNSQVVLSNQERVTVETGIRSRGWAEVRSGLSESVSLVCEGWGN